MAEPDFLDRMIAKRAAQNPEFPQLVAAARRRRALLRALAERREASGRTQTAVAEAMETAQSFVARLESSADDTKLSTLERYAAALGYTVQYHLVGPGTAADAPPLVVDDP